MLVLISASLAAAATTTIDVAAATDLGMPRLHDPYVECQCVGMTWDSDGDSLVLEVPLVDIVGLQRVVHGDGHDVSLVLVGGEKLLIEQAPCIFSQQVVDRYESVLGLKAELVDEAGDAVEPACGDVLHDVRQWSADVAKQHRDNTHYLVTEDIPLASLKVVSSKGDDAAVTGARRALAATRTRAASCWTGQAAADPHSVQITVKGSGGGRPKVTAKSVGVGALDQCFDEIASAVSIPSGKMKIKAVYGPPVPPG